MLSYAIREAVAMGEAITSHIRTQYNWADLLTKVLYGNKRREMVGGILYDIYDETKQPDIDTMTEE